MNDIEDEMERLDYEMTLLDEEIGELEDKQKVKRERYDELEHILSTRKVVYLNEME